MGHQGLFHPIVGVSIAYSCHTLDPSIAPMKGSTGPVSNSNSNKAIRISFLISWCEFLKKYEQWLFHLFFWIRHVEKYKVETTQRRILFIIYIYIYMCVCVCVCVERENSWPIISWHIILPSPQNTTNYKVPRIAARFCYHYLETNRNLPSVMQKSITHQRV